jgi:predicted ATP-grasp superfamily ATP-dependent carboligase
MSRGSLLIVGASGRAAAASAIRAGYTPFVIDLFGDEDTRRLCPVLTCSIESYPRGFVELAEQVPPMPWMYTGGLENFPEVIDAISQKRELMGNGPAVIAVFRNPTTLAERVRTLGGTFPETYSSDQVEIIDPNVRWLRKSIRSSGGLGVREFSLGNLENDPLTAVETLQRYIDGIPMSAIYTTRRGRTTLLGITRQLIGESWLHARDFAYAGNITMPFHRCHWSLREHYPEMANCDGLEGVWGLDYIDLKGFPYSLEINPRYTAACELFDFAYQRSVLMDWDHEPAELVRAYGKAIYFAQHPITLPSFGPWDDSLNHCTDVWRRPDYADIPAPGTTIERGQPVLTILAEGDAEENMLHTLKTRAAELDRLFGIS